MRFKALNYSAVQEQLEILTIRKWSILYLGLHYFREKKDIILGFFDICLEMKIKP